MWRYDIYGVVLFVVMVTAIFDVSTAGRRHRRRDTSEALGGGITDDAIRRLSRVFGIDRVPAHRYTRRSPPEYMLDLYRSVADQDGITISRTPYGSDVVRGLPDRDTHHQTHFFFNVSYIHPAETVLEAEFHLYRMRPRPAVQETTVPRNLHLVDLSLYEVLDPQLMYSPSGLRLLERRPISTHKHGWEVFKVKLTVQRWVNHNHNHGFLVRATAKDGSAVNGSYVRFAQRSEHHDSKQPVLVVFTNSDRLKKQMEEANQARDEEILSDEAYTDTQDQWSPEARMYIQALNERERAEQRRSFYQLQAELSSDFDSALAHNQAKRRTKRSARNKRDRDKSAYTYTNYPRRRKQNCARHELYVDFDEIGWSGWIISPKGYNAYHCSGECPFPLGQNQKPTNHATVQSIVNALEIGKRVGTPCCVPNKLYSISLLYFDDNDNVLLKHYDDMVAVSCGCH